MKIVHVSNFPVSKNGAFVFGVPFKLTSGLTRLGHFGANFADRDVADGYFLGARKLGAPLANRQLVRFCRELRPDLILLGHCCVIAPETIAQLREAVPSVRIAHWNVDGLFVPRNFMRLARLAPLVDMTLMTTAGNYLHQIAGFGGRVAYMPNPVDKAVESLKVFERNDVPNDLVFLCGNKKYNGPRLALCEAIRDGIPELKFDARGFWGRPGAYGAEFFDALGSARMGLSLSARDNVYLYSSDRMAQLMGCGLLTFIHRATGFGDLFAEDELVSYADPEELIAKLHYYRGNDHARRDVARRGWARVHADFNEAKVAQWILDATFEGGPRQSYAWPTDIADGIANPPSLRVPA
ncbi:MAG: glycosyltransferase [Alphaproteobacteria bacterium]|nr:glycosyltransferase [Alphaproteobacteria bacterium]